MKLTNSQIIKFFNIGFMEKKLPLRLSHAIILNVEMLQPAVAAIETSRKELIKKYAVLGDDGQPALEKDALQFSSHEEMENFTREHKELMGLYSDVNVNKVPLEVLEKCDHEGFDSLTLAEADAIMFMVEGERDA